LKAKKPGLKIAVAGCMAQRRGFELLKEYDAIDLVFGTHVIPTASFLMNKVFEGQRIVDIAEKGIEQKINAIRAELAMLSKTIKTLNTDIQKAITEMPEHPGIYHENFFERLRTILVLIRTQIEDSRTWLTMWTDRKKKKGFWASYKKHGTKFGLSSERTVSMSAG